MPGCRPAAGSSPTYPTTTLRRHRRPTPPGKPEQGHWRSPTSCRRYPSRGSRMSSWQMPGSDSPVLYGWPRTAISTAPAGGTEIERKNSSPGRDRRGFRLARCRSDGIGRPPFCRPPEFDELEGVGEIWIAIEAGMKTFAKWGYVEPWADVPLEDMLPVEFLADVVGYAAKGADMISGGNVRSSHPGRHFFQTRRVGISQRRPRPEGFEQSLQPRRNLGQAKPLRNRRSQVRILSGALKIRLTD